MIKAATLTITVVTSGHSTFATDGSVFRFNAITGKDIRAFAPAIRKPAAQQPT